MNSAELLAVIESMEKERGIEREHFIQMLESALLSASRKSMGPTRDLRIEIDKNTLKIKVFATVEVVEKVREKDEQISLEAAKAIKADAALGDLIEITIIPKNFGRIAAQAAKQAIVQRIRLAEKEVVLKEYSDKIGDVVSGTVQRLEHNDLIINLEKVEAIMPMREQVRTEDYLPGDHIRAFVLSVQEHTSGHHIVLSRSHPNFVRRLFELEISEIADKTVEIKSVAREAGIRSKIAVVSHDEKVDAVGACVGMRGLRVKNIVRELSGEKIDIVRWHEDIKTFVANALAPAKLNHVFVDEASRTIEIIVDADQLSLAIGKRGQNARLTSRLLGWKIDIQKDKEDISFEEKVNLAIGSLSQVDGISREQAGKLVKAGFLTVDGIAAADIADLEEMAELDTETAMAIKESVKQAMESAEEEE
ncbi:MAG: transcription termination/antitermination protein NusA [Lentisphaerae bacterium]|nr:transcription termination/antitermination protein NusA [Lentisphaerota bacterium]